MKPEFTKPNKGWRNSNNRLRTTDVKDFILMKNSCDTKEWFCSYHVTQIDWLYKIYKIIMLH